MVALPKLSNLGWAGRIGWAPAVALHLTLACSSCLSIKLLESGWATYEQGWVKTTGAQWQFRERTGCYSLARTNLMSVVFNEAWRRINRVLGIGLNRKVPAMFYCMLFMYDVLKKIKAWREQIWGKDSKKSKDSKRVSEIEVAVSDNHVAQAWLWYEGFPPTIKPFSLDQHQLLSHLSEMCSALFFLWLST